MQTPSMKFLSRNFPDARELMPDCARGIQRASGRDSWERSSAQPWHTQAQATLIGDAAHAMVPLSRPGHELLLRGLHRIRRLRRAARFLGKGVCGIRRRAANPTPMRSPPWRLTIIMEMRESVAEPKFQLQQALSLELERRFPQRFIPRYSMVMFHHEIPYLTAQRRGATQAAILSDLTRGAVNACCRRSISSEPERG